jgi:tetratricopeptide (TPR) repeat protein
MKGSEKLREAKILFASGELEKSVEAFTLAEGDGCDPVDACLSRGAARMALGKHQEAEQDFTKVLGKDPKNERACYFRGIALVALGQYEEAIEYLTRSLTKKHDRGIAYLARGVAYSELGRQKLAALDMNSASAFSSAELASFRNLFGNLADPFRNTKELLAEENAPWNNLISKASARKLLKCF